MIPYILKKMTYKKLDVYLITITMYFSHYPLMELECVNDKQTIECEFMNKSVSSNVILISDKFKCKSMVIACFIQ